MGRLSPRQAIPGLEPTEKQIRCVNIIVNKLRINPPTEFTKAAYSDFISEYMAESKKKPYERRNHADLDAGDTSGIDDFIGQFQVLRGGC